MNKWKAKKGSGEQRETLKNKQKMPFLGEILLFNEKQRKERKNNKKNKQQKRRV